MDADNCALACGLVSKTYIQQGSQALARRRRLIKSLLSTRRLPVQGWDDATIEMLLQDAALMDSNNFVDNVGVGEREARVASELVARRHYRLAHGIGRSGDIAAEQPKAAGSSLLAKLSHLLAAQALEVAGMREVGAALVVPLATGMALTVVLLALRGTRPPTTRYVLWPRIDQKTCLKSIQAAGFEAVVIPMRREGDQLVTDMAALQRELERLGGPHVVAAVVTTTSCFAPRAADDVVAVAKLCQQAGVAHIINNAYGVQSAALCAQVCSAWRKGRVDAVVQSTDKNFMVPVGGAIIAARRGATQLVRRVDHVARQYPGRACMSPLLDLLITLLHWGAAGWRDVLQQREQLLEYARRRLQAFAEAQGERVLETPGNPISLALTLASFDRREGQPGGSADVAPTLPSSAQDWADPQPGGAADVAGGQAGEPAGAVASEPAATAQQAAAAEQQQPHGVSASAVDGGSGSSGSRPAPPITFLGSMLFQRCVSGTRVVARGVRQEVGGLAFTGYGAHCDHFPCDYLTVAAALGTSEADIDELVRRLAACFAEFRQRRRRTAAAGLPAAATVAGGSS